MNVLYAFGLVNALGTFQRLMETCLGNLQLNWCHTYLDHVIVFSKNLKVHLSWLRAISKKLKKAGLKLKPSKCEFLKKHLTYFGHRILEEGIETDVSKIKIIWEWPVPKTVSRFRSFLGFTNYYGSFIGKYSQVSQLLYKLISGENALKRIKSVIQMKFRGISAISGNWVNMTYLILLGTQCRQGTSLDTHKQCKSLEPKRKPI